MGNTKQEGAERKMQLDLSAEVAAGTYSNLVVISHSISEFVLDFARIMPGVDSPRVVSSVIMTPDHAKRLLLALTENVRRYEYLHGEIDLHEDVANPEIPFVGDTRNEA